MLQPNLFSSTIVAQHGVFAHRDKEKSTTLILFRGQRLWQYWGLAYGLRAPFLAATLRCTPSMCVKKEPIIPITKKTIQSLGL